MKYLLFLLATNSQQAYAQPAEPEQKWFPYLTGMAATAIAMPITYATAKRATTASNRLIIGAIPPISIALALPAVGAWYGTHWGARKTNFGTPHPWKALGTTLATNAVLFATGALIGTDIDDPRQAVRYGVASAVLLPLPTWLMAQKTTNTPFIIIQPTTKETFISGGYHGSF